MKKVALVVNAFPTVSESFIVNKVIGLIDNGFDITVISQKRKNDAKFYKERLANYDIKVISSAGKSLFKVMGYLLAKPFRFLKLYFQVAKNEGFGSKGFKLFLKLVPYKFDKFDIIHFEMSGIAAENHQLLDYLKPSKIFMSCRGSAEKVKPLVDEKRKKVLTEMFPKLERVHCVSEDMLKTVEEYGLDRKNAFVNRPSIFPDLFKRTTEYTDSPKLRILTVGRLTFAKGYVFALNAMKILKDEGVDFVYEILGAGDDKAQLVYSIKALGLQNHIILLGRRSGEFVRKKIENIDVFLLPSLYEGISNAALEAMSMEVPVISTKSGGMEEAIDDGVDGYLVDCFSPEQIADSLKNIALDFEKRKTLGIAGREKILQKFQMARQLETFINEYSK